MARKKEIDQDRILDAAEETILEVGGLKLTLEAVAERAKVSKGTLTYTFGSKNELIAAAMAREMARFTEAVMARAPEDTPRGRILGYAREVATRSNAPSTVKAGTLLTALLHVPGMLGPVHEYYRRLFADFAPQSPASRRIRLAVLAMESVFWLRGTGVAEEPPEVWRSIMQDAYAMILEAIEAEKAEPEAPPPL